MSFLPLVKLWLWISVLATVAGWTLSALGELNRTGYAIFCCAAALLLWLGRGRLHLSFSSRGAGGAKFRRRFRRPVPLAFALLSLLVLLGGVLYPPPKKSPPRHRLPGVLPMVG